MTDRRDTVVSDGGSSAGIILGAIVLVLLLVIGWYLFLGPGAGGQETTQPGLDIDVNIPTLAPAPEAS